MSVVAAAVTAAVAVVVVVVVVVVVATVAVAVDIVAEAVDVAVFVAVAVDSIMKPTITANQNTEFLHAAVTPADKHFVNVHAISSCADFHNLC